MSLLKSVLFGCEGSYNIFEIPVKFENELPTFGLPSLERRSVISQLAFKCINSAIFRYVTQSYTHVFMHEMSHALACKLLTGKKSEIVFFTTLGLGQTVLPIEIRDSANWKRTAVDVAGPMGNIAFSTCKLVAAIALKNYLTWPVALTLGGGAVIWMSGELFYAYISASNKDRGDFGRIVSRGNTHLVLASMTLVSQVALGIFLAIKLVI